jgi:hypothetical protein
MEQLIKFSRPFCSAHKVLIRVWCSKYMNPKPCMLFYVLLRLLLLGRGFCFRSSPVSKTFEALESITVLVKD